MMQCTDINELMMDFIYREMEAKREDEFRAHVASCSKCGAELASLERTRSALRELPEAEPPAAVTARLLHEAAKRAPRASEEERGGVLSWLAGLFRPVMAHPGWAAAASLVVLVGVVYLQRAGKLSSKSQENPNVTAQRSDEAAQAAPEAPMAAAPSRTVPGAAPAGEKTAGPAPVVLTSPPAVEVKTEGYAESTVSLDGKSMDGRGLDIQGGAHGVKLDKGSRTKVGADSMAEADPSALKDALKEKPVYRQTDDLSRTAVLEGDDRATARLLEEQKRGRAEMNEKAKEGAKDKAKADYDRPADPAPAEAPAMDDEDEAEVAVVNKPQAGATGGAPAPRKPAPEPVRENRPSMSPTTTTGAVVAAGAPAPAQAGSSVPAQPPPANNVRRDANKSGGGGTNVGGNIGNVNRVQEQKKSEAKLDTTAAKLHLQAQQAAKTGNCNVALETRRKIQRVDSDYYKRNVAKDAVFSECEAKERATKKKKAAPRAQDEMSEPAPASPAADEAANEDAL